MCVFKQTYNVDVYMYVCETIITIVHCVEVLHFPHLINNNYQESSSEIRDALRGLLSSCRITTSAGLNTTIHALLDNLKKYPIDRESIWKCLKQLGNNHGSLVSTLVPELLSTHPFFMGKEPDVDDPACIQ